jgi:hypothetical protein
MARLSAPSGCCLCPGHLRRAEWGTIHGRQLFVGCGRSLTAPDCFCCSDIENRRLLRKMVRWALLLNNFSSRPTHPTKIRFYLPWLYVSPALLLTFFFLVYPISDTLVLSLVDNKTRYFVGLENYQ